MSIKIEPISVCVIQEDFEGLPEKSMPYAKFLVALREENPRTKDSSFLLYKFSKDGASAGDTWHQTMEELIEQAHSEYDIEAFHWVDWCRLAEPMKTKVLSYIPRY